ncbi:hypothetical protein [Streptomyces sp. Tue6028]|uniref:hypothetical protein n=1 Tax=Streptomyces sp. Tue6028 TaxID=2036037 RepID=UPI003D717B74
MTSPSTHRIRILVAVVNDPHEVDLAKQCFSERDWRVLVWEASQDLVTALGNGRVGLLVEARLEGSSFGAVRTAVRVVDRLARDRHIGMWALDAFAYNPRQNNGPLTVYEVRDQPGTDAVRPWPYPWRWLLHRVNPSGHRVVSWPAGSSRDDVEAALSLGAGALLDIPFEPGRHRVTETGDSIAPLLSALPNVRAQWWPVLATMSLAALVGAIGHVAAWPIAGATLMGLAWWLGEDVVPVGRPWYWRLLRGVILALILGWAPYRAASQQQGPEVVGGALLILVSGLVLWQMGFALRNSWFSRNASWILPLLIPALAVSLPWLGELQYSTYLDSGFGIPPDTVSIALPARYAVTQLPLVAAGAMVVVMTLFIGICRYFYIPVGRDRLTSSSQRILLITCIIAVLAAPVVVGISTADNLAGAARAEAHSGHVPEQYYGLRGRLVCVHVLDSDFPVFNGPIPYERPLLTFGSSGDQVWLWDPVTDEAISAPADGVALERFVSGWPRCGS